VGLCPNWYPLLGPTETTALYRISIYEDEHSSSGGRGWFDERSDLTESGRSFLNSP